MKIITSIQRHADKKTKATAALPLADFEWRSVMLMACLSACVLAGARAQAQPSSFGAALSVAPSTMATPAYMSDAAAAQTVRQPVTGSDQTGEGLRDNVSATRSNAKSLDAAFRRADRDGDGRLSRQEAEHFPALAQQFEQFDENRDSFISREEFNRAANQ